MKYKVYYKRDAVQTYFKEDSCIVSQPDSKKDILTFSINNRNLSYQITNPSDHTLYLLNNNLLRLGVFINENKKRYTGNNWRSQQSLLNHPHRKFWRSWTINSLNGTINMGYRPTSITLSFIFDKSIEYEDPYRENGYDDFYIGIGNSTDSMRPYSMSEAYRIWIDNPN